MGSKISEVASLQVNAERRRLEQNQYIAESEKRLYVKVFDLSRKIILSGIYIYIYIYIDKLRFQSAKQK